MIRRVLPAILVAGIAALTVLSASCGGHSNGADMNMHVAPKEGVIDVHLSNWAVEPAVSSAGAGPITFRAIHDMGHGHMAKEGGVIHDLTVARKLPNGEFEVIARVTDIAMGQAKELTVDLPSGEYELQCNTVEELANGKTVAHYLEGMHTGFTVS